MHSSHSCGEKMFFSKLIGANFKARYLISQELDFWTQKKLNLFPFNGLLGTFMVVNCMVDNFNAGILMAVFWYGKICNFWTYENQTFFSTRWDLSWRWIVLQEIELQLFEVTDAAFLNIRKQKLYDFQQIDWHKFQRQIFDMTGTEFLNTIKSTFIF